MAKFTMKTTTNSNTSIMLSLSLHPVITTKKTELRFELSLWSYCTWKRGDKSVTHIQTYTSTIEATALRAWPKNEQKCDIQTHTSPIEATALWEWPKNNQKCDIQTHTSSIEATALRVWPKKSWYLGPSDPILPQILLDVPDHITAPCGTCFFVVTWIKANQKELKQPKYT